MRDTLRLFTNNSSLQESSEALLDKLGIKYSPLLRGVPFDDYFRQSGFTFHYVEEIEKCIDHIWNIGYVNDTTFEKAEANDDNAKYFGLSIFACDIKPEVSFTRSMAVALTRAFNRISTQNVNNQFDMPVVVIMRQGEMLSLATCERSGRQDGQGEKVGKVTILRDMNSAHLHAGHRQILERIKENVHGCNSYEELHQKWFDSFNIDILSDNFFNGYKNIYEDIIEYITGKRMVKKASKWVEHDNKHPNAEIMAEFSCFENPEKAVRDYVKNLMGRLVFIQFLQKKGWMGVPAGESWNGGDPDFLQNLFHASEHKDDFVDKVLEPLFKDLNTHRENDLVQSVAVHLGNQIKVPYLNGGLFEISDSDTTRFKIPSKFFWNEDEREAEKKPGILRLFSNFNFTIDENAPDNVEIGVDPEMLSRIFENLLEDNKEKGAFYTPKEIVQYMCRESLTAYLQTDKTEDEKKDIRAFVLTNNVDVLEENLKEDIDEKLTNIKICDPAIGSGAFPMGMLKELYSCRRALEGLNDENAAEIKKHIIQNNIYGVDIEKGAVDIARLRFWLSIVVDEKTPHALPNMDFKIMQGDSLIPTFNGKYVNLTSKLRHVNSSKIRDAKRRLFNLQQEYYSSEGNYKLELLVQIKLQILEIVKLQMDYEYQQEVANNAETMDLFNPQPLKEVKIDEEKRRIVGMCLNLQRELSAPTKSLEDKASIRIPFFDWKIMFSDVFNNEKEGFDIVIGNPPYIKEGRMSKSYFDKYKISPYYKGKMDIWYMFACNGLDLLNANGLLCFIATNNWVTSFGASKLRDKVITETRICNLVDFGAVQMFESASIQTMVMMFQKDTITDNYTFDYRKLVAAKATVDDAIEMLEKTSNKADFFYPSVKRSDYYGKTFTFSKSEDLMETIKGAPNIVYLEDNEVAQGIVPNPDVINSRNIKNFSPEYVRTNKIQVGDGVFVVNKGTFSHLSTEEQKYIKDIVEPTNCERFYINYQTDKEILYITKSNYRNDAPNLLKHLWKYRNVMEQRRENQNGRLDYFHLHWPREERFFKTGAKILVPRKAVVPTFSYTEDEAYVMMAINIIQTTKVDLKYLTGLFNSTLVEYWLRNKGKMQGANYQLDKEPLQQIPIAVPELEVQSKVAEIIDTIILKKSTDLQADTRELERTIDNIIYDIYGLKSLDIQIIEDYIKN